MASSIFFANTIVVLFLFVAPAFSARPFLFSDSYLTSFHLTNLNLLSHSGYPLLSFFPNPDSRSLPVQDVGSFFYPKPVRFSSPFPSRHPISFSSFFSFAPDLDNSLAFVISPDAHASYSRLSSSPRAFRVHFDSKITEPAADPTGKIASQILVRANASNLAVPFKGGDRLYVWIDYHSPVNALEVRLSKSPRFRPWRPHFFEEIDLSSICKEEMFVGFSSSAGDLPLKHVVRSWSFTTTNGHRHSIRENSRLGGPFRGFSSDLYRPGFGISFVSKMDDLLRIGMSLILGALCAFAVTASVLLFWSFIRQWTNSCDGEAVMQPILLGYQHLPSGNMERSNMMPKEEGGLGGDEEDILSRPQEGLDLASTKQARNGLLGCTRRQRHKASKK